MSVLGDVVNYGTPIGWANQASGGDIGKWAGMATGANGFQTNPGSYQLPQLLQMQQQSQQNSQNALNQKAPGMDRSGVGFQGQQQQLASMLMRQAQGGGPDIAGAKLKQDTDKNIAQQYALASSRPNDAGALRSIASNTGNINQQAAGQAEQNRMQQMLAAQQQLAGVTQSGVGNAFNQQQLQQQQFGMNNQAGLGWANYGQNANLAQLQAQIEQQKIASGAYANQANNAQSAFGGLISGLGTAIGLAHGGMVPGYSDGGPVGIGWDKWEPPILTPDAPMLGGLKGKGKKAGSGSPGSDPYASMNASAATGMNSGLGTGDFGLDAGAGSGTAMAFAAHGGPVPGTPAVKGDSPKNDKVPAMLSPGEEVIPASIAGNRQKEIEFLDKIKVGKGPKPTFKDVLQSHKNLQERIAKVEALCRGGKALYASSGVEVPGYEDPFGLQQQEAEPPSAPAFNEMLSAPLPDQTYAPEKSWRDRAGLGMIIPTADSLKGIGSSIVGGLDRAAAGIMGGGASEPAQEPIEKRSPTAEAGAGGSGQATQETKPFDFNSVQVPPGRAAGVGGGGGGLEAEIIKGSKEKQAAETEKGRVSSDLAAAQQQQYIDDAKAQQTQAAAIQAKYDGYQERADETAEKIANSQIDPNHFWASKSTGQKLTGAFAMVLGGLGGGMTHQGNPVQAMYDKAIDRDIEGQKANLGKQQGLLSHYVQQGHSVLEAGQLAKADAMTYASAMHLAMAAKYGGPADIAAAKANNAQTTMEAAKMRQDVRDHAQANSKTQLELDMMKRQALMQPLMTGIGQHAENGNVVPEVIQGPDGRPMQTGAALDPKRRVKVPGGWAYAKTDKAMEELDKNKVALVAFKDAVQRVRGLSKQSGFGGSTGQEGGAAVQALEDAYQALLGRSNAPRGPQEKRLSDALSNPTSWWKTSGGINAVMNQLEDVANSQAIAMNSAYLVGGAQAAAGIQGKPR